MPEKIYSDVYVQEEKKESIHPCPADFNTWLSIMTLIESNVVFDPFCGTGTSLLAGKSLQKKLIGIDKNEKYLNMCATSIGNY